MPGSRHTQTPRRLSHTVRRIDRHIIDTLKTSDALMKGGEKEFLALVNRLRQQVVLAVVENGDLTPYTKARLRSVVVEIIEVYRKRFEELLSTNERRLFVKGIQLVDTTVKTANLTAAVPYLSEQTLAQVQQYSADLVTNLTEYSRQRITQELDLAVLGQKPQVDVVRAIGRNLKDPSIFGTISKRAMTIYQTEVNRIHNLATAQRIKQVSQVVPDLKKQWMHSHRGVPRPGHLSLDSTIVDAYGRFDLKGADGKVYKVLAPHDPILPPSETVNCRCHEIPIVGRFQREES